MPSSSRLRGAAVLAGACVALTGPLVVPASAQSGAVTVQVVGFSDFHGRLEPVDETDDGDPVGGAVQLAGAVEALVAANPDTVLASAGDSIGASTFTSNVQQDAPTITALNEAGLAVSAVGNHEFDRGFADIAPGGRVDDLAEFPYLGANVYEAGTTTPLLDTSEVITTPSGVRLGFVGVVTQETASLVAPAGIAGIEFGDEAEAAVREAALLRDGDDSNGEADVVVLLLHDGSPAGDCAADPTLQALTDQIDAVIAGHTHESYECDPFTATGGFEGPVVQAGPYGEALDLLTFTVDPDAGTVEASAEIRPLTGAPTDGPRATAVAATVDAAVAFAQEEGARPLGEITADITRAFASPADEEADEDDRGSESVLGNFIADVQLAQTRDLGAQIAFMNPGGLRDDLRVEDVFGDEALGVVTLGEAAAVQPFANGVVTLSLTGAQVEQVLEEQWQPQGASRPFLALGVSEGLFFTYDDARAEGDRITSVTLDGQPLDPAATYRVTVNSFLASGGDNFTTLAEGTDRRELGISDLEALTAYLAENSPVTADPAPRRAVGTPAPAPTPTPSPGGVNPGLDVDTGLEDEGQGPLAGLLAAGLLGAALLGAAAARVRAGSR